MTSIAEHLLEHLAGRTGEFWCEMVDIGVNR